MVLRLRVRVFNLGGTAMTTCISGAGCRHGEAREGALDGV